MNYAELRGHPADFEVRYRIIFTAEEGGRITGPPWQHYRCDWAYDGDDISQTGIFMIHPEFMLPDSSVFPEGSAVAMDWPCDDVNTYSRDASRGSPVADSTRCARIFHGGQSQSCRGRGDAYHRTTYQTRCYKEATTVAPRRTKRMQATARMASGVSSTLPARRRLIRNVRQAPTKCPDGGIVGHWGLPILKGFV